MPTLPAPGNITPVKTNGKPTVSRSPQGRIASTALAGDRKKENQRLDQLAERMEEDYQVALARRVLEARVQSIPVTFSVEGGDARAEALKEQLEDLWEQSLAEALQCIPEGRVAFEKVMGFTDPNLTVFRKLEALPFSKTEMTLEGDGSFAGILLKPTGKDPVPIPAPKSWWLALDPTPLEPHGRSRYMGAPHATWKARKEAFKNRETFLRRFALGNAVYRGPSSREDEQGNTIDVWQEAANAYEQSRAGGLFTMSAARDDEGNFEEEFTQLPEPKDGQPIDATIDSMDAEQIRAFGFSEKTVTEGAQVGSFAMVKSQMGLLDAVALGILSQIATSFQKFVIDKAVAINFGAPTPVKITVDYPRLRESVDDYVLEVVQGWLTADTLSPLLLSGAVDVGQMLGAVGVPVSDDLDARIAEMLQRARKRREAPPPGSQPPAQPEPAGGPARPFSHRPTGARDLAVALPEAVPEQESHVGAALAELDGLYRELVDTLAGMRGRNVDEGPLRTLIRRVRLLDGDARAAARLIGMVSLWRPELTDVPESSQARLPPRLQRAAAERSAPSQGAHNPFGRGAASRGIQMRLPGLDNEFSPLGDGEAFRFPWAEDAVRFLEELQVASRGQLRAMAAADRQAVFEAAGIDDPVLLAELKDALRESLRRGESLREFRERLGEAVALDRAQTETLYRTNTKRAHIAGQEAAMQSPGVAEEFPFVLHAATRDLRVRPEHWALDGFVVRRGTPEHRIVLAAQRDWNCILPGNRIKGDLLCGVRSWYSGKAVELVTLAGAKLRVTENHPVLTAHGLVPAGSISCGDQLLPDVGLIPESGYHLPVDTLRARPSQDNHMPPVVEHAFDALWSRGFHETPRAQPGDFHGEAQFFCGDVDVVWSDAKLLRHSEAVRTENVGDFILETPVSTAMCRSSLPRPLFAAHLRPLEPFSVRSPANGYAGFAQSILQSASADPEPFADRLERLPAAVGTGDKGGIDGGLAAACLNATALEPPPDRCRSDTEVRGDFRAVPASAVEGGRVVGVRHFDYSGPTYDFQSNSGLIVVGGLWIGNCRCAPIPLSVEDAGDYVVKTLDDIPAIVLERYAFALEQVAA